MRAVNAQRRDIIMLEDKNLMTHLRRTIVLLFFSCCIAPLAMGQVTFKVKIQSTPMERQLLFAKLNERAATHHIQFVLVESGFDYRVAYGVAGPRSEERRVGKE